MTLHDTFIPRDNEGRHTDLLQDEGWHSDGREEEQREDGDHGGGGMDWEWPLLLRLCDTDMRRLRW